MDVDELLGRKLMGLKMTTDQQAIVDLEVNCVAWCGYFPLPHVMETLDKLEEYCDLETTTDSEKMWNAAGFGLSVEEEKQLKSFRENRKKYYFVETLNLASMSLYGKMLDDFEVHTDYHLSEEIIRQV